jgi:hypothetical protein
MSVTIKQRREYSKGSYSVGYIKLSVDRRELEVINPTKQI